LPNQPGSFNLIEDEDYSSTTTITEYIDEIFDNRRTELPYMYGSYQTYSANKADQQYKFVSHLNLTAYDSPGLYPQFMYESIMKQATDNDDFKFKVRLTPYPPTTRLLLRANGEELNTIIIQMSIAFGIFLAGIARYIVVERESGLKHLQIISGMQLKAYWVATFICDFLKMYLTILVAIILWAAFDLDLNAAMVPLALLPFGALPFTYATTFVFSSSQAASSINMFLNILILGILASITWTFRIAIPPFMDYGDSMHSWFWLIPSYNIGAAMFCDRQCDTLADVRKAPYVDAPETDADKWAFPNLTRDSLVMLLHMVVWSIVIMVIEKGWLSVCSRKPKAKTSDANDLDDDVVAEQQRVE
jgi:ATP-binding cassette subfamily A (ABC1) protein 3